MPEPDVMRGYYYIPMVRGFMHLFCVMGWYSRKILAWELSNTLDTDFYLRALNKAVETTGTVPEIFNTDQGCQFTSDEWMGRLTDLGIAISMDGKGRWLYNVVIERLWRSIKYEDIYLKSCENAWELERPHQPLKEEMPEEVYAKAVKLAA